jgi:hypothetical protein
MSVGSVWSEHSGRVLRERLGLIGGQAVLRSKEDDDRAGLLVDPDLLAPNADREVGASVAVRVAGGQRRAERIPGLGDPRSSGGVLREPGASLDGQAARRAVEHVDDPGVRTSGAEVLPQDVDRQVGVPVPVEVAGCSSPSEEVVGLGLVGRGTRRAR